MPSAFELLNKRTVRAPVNEMDKCTIVSIYPREINERKRTIVPGRFHIEPGTAEKPALLIVGPSSWWRDMGDNEPLMEIPQSSIIVADSVVRDWSNGIVGCDMAEKMPGLFFIPGEWTLAKILADPIQKARLEDAKRKQKNWFEELVKMADIYWARSNGNPLVIMDDMRLAAEVLNKKDRDWFQGVTYAEVITCKACGNVNKAGFPVCPNCKAIVDPDAAAKLGIKFAS